MELAPSLIHAIELVTLVIEITAIVIIVAAILYGIFNYVREAFMLKQRAAAYRTFKVRLGSASFWDWKSWSPPILSARSPSNRPSKM